MKNYTKIKRLGHKMNRDILENPEDELIFKEKLDGSNFRFTVVEHEGEVKFLFGSKNVEYKINGEPDYEENVQDQFQDAVDYIRENFEPEQFALNYTYFMENMVQHSLEYEWDDTPQVIAFDIYDERKEEYLTWEAAEKIFKDVGLETSPVVERMKAKAFNPDDYEIPESNYRDGKMEGVVIINQDKEENHLSGFNSRAKMVTEEFKEKHKKQTGARQSVEAVKGHEKVISKYCTDGRIRKHINKMKEDGRDLEMEMMQNKGDDLGLPMRVSIDILEEEAADIVTRNEKMDWKEYRSLISKRCVRVLRQEMQKSAGGRVNEDE